MAQFITEDFVAVPRRFTKIEGLSLEDRGAFLDLCHLSAIADIQVVNGKTIITIVAGQLAHSVRWLAQRWSKTKDWVYSRLKNWQKVGLLKLAKNATRDKTASDIVTLCHIRENSPASENDATQNATRSRHEHGQSKKRENGKKEDSCHPQAADQPEEDPFAGLEPQPRPAGAGPSNPVPPLPSEPEPESVKSPPNSAAPPRLYPEAFDNLWLKVPKAAKRGGKSKPFAVWKKANATVRAEIERGVELWAKRDGDRTEFVPMAQTWFNQRRWETEIETASPEQSDYSREMDELYA
jgi:hypothetical protein